jgi:hypothetical protein
MYAGGLSTIFGKTFQKVHAAQDAESEYAFRFLEKPYTPCSRTTKEYYKLNECETKEKGISLKECISKRLITIDGNVVLFRGKRLVTLENTIFHMLGNENMFLDGLSRISFGYFRKLLSAESENRYFFILKTLLQSFGFGMINVISDENNIVIDVKNPTYGLQKYCENWEFLAHVILGYLWLVDKKIKYEGSKVKFKRVTLYYKRQK